MPASSTVKLLEQSICDALRDLILSDLYNLKNVKNTHEAVSVLVKFYFTKSDTAPWVFFTFFKLYKRHQIAQLTTYVGVH